MRQLVRDRDRQREAETGSGRQRELGREIIILIPFREKIRQL